MVGLAHSFAELLSFADDGRRDRGLADACMAAAALVASAEGAVSFAERATVDQVIDALAERGAAEASEAAERFDALVDGIIANSSHGRKAALAALADMDGEAAVAVVRVARAVACANGAAGPEEAAAVAEIEAALAADC